MGRQAYAEYTLASPLNRLATKPVIPDTLKEEKWARLERKVMTLLLGSMKKSAKEDAVTHRILDVPSLLFRLHVLYQPGGVSERAAVLKHLEGKPIGEDVHECVAALRKWRRYLERAEAMHVSVPDSSILFRALETMIKKVTQAYPEVKFRIDLTKNELQLQGRPTLEAVLRFYTHVLAELQMIAPVAAGTTTPSIKAIGTGQSGGTGDASTPTSSPAANATPILPLGALVQELGCDLTWTRKGGLKVVHPQFGVLRTFVKGNHPVSAETQALDIISQLEDLQLRALETQTAETFVRTESRGNACWKLCRLSSRLLESFLRMYFRKRRSMLD